MIGKVDTLRILQVIKIPSIQIMLFLLEKGETRHTNLCKLITSRGTLTLSLKDLEKENLIQRRVLDTKPIQSLYSLTPKGKTVAQHLSNAANAMHLTEPQPSDIP